MKDFYSLLYKCIHGFLSNNRIIFFVSFSDSDSNSDSEHLFIFRAFLEDYF